MRITPRNKAILEQEKADVIVALNGTADQHHTSRCHDSYDIGFLEGRLHELEKTIAECK